MIKPVSPEQKIETIKLSVSESKAVTIHINRYGEQYADIAFLIFIPLFSSFHYLNNNLKTPISTFKMVVYVVLGEMGSKRRREELF